MIRDREAVFTPVVNYEHAPLRLESENARAQLVGVPFLIRCPNCTQEAVFFIDDGEHTLELVTVAPEPVVQPAFAPALEEMNFIDFARLVRGLVRDVLPKAQKQDQVDEIELYRWMNGKRCAQLHRENRPEYNAGVLCLDFADAAAARGHLPVRIPLNYDSAKYAARKMLEWLQLP